MGFIFPFIAIVAGLLAASSIVIQKLPDSAELINKIKPYEGYIGAASLVMGFITLFSFSYIMKTNLINIVGTFSCIASCIIMGFLMGYPVLQDLFLDEMSEESRNKSKKLYEKLTPYKVTSGLVGMATGVIILLF